MSITKHCGQWLLYNKVTGASSRFFCGMVTCDRPECAEKFRAKRVNLIQELVEKYDLRQFVTLTMTREMPLEAAWRGIAAVWNKFLTVIRRKYPGFVYVAVLESHNALVEGRRTVDGIRENWGGCDDGYESFVGYPHVHYFSSTWLKKREASAHFANCGGGPVAWVKRIDEGDDVATYVCKQVAKYVGKQNLVLAKQIMGKGKRTIWRSQSLKTDREIAGKSGNWEILKENCFGEGGEKLYDMYKEGNEFVAVAKRITGNNFEIRS